MSTEGCCPPTRVPKLEKSENGKGEFLPIGEGKETMVYVSGDKNSKQVLVVCPDIFGFKTGRHTSLCDFFADNGYLVLMPDYFENDPLGDDPNMIAYIKKHVAADAQRVLDEVYKNFIADTVEKVTMMGFCYGCWIIFKESQRNSLPGKLKIGACFHPSVQIEELLGHDLKKLGNDLKHPMLLVPTEGDNEIVQKGTYLEKEPFNCTVLPFTHQKHGFMTQGDAENDEKVKNDIVHLLNETLKVFSKY